MNTKILKKVGTIFLVFSMGIGLIFVSFVCFDFPFAVDPIPNLVWIELVFLAVLLGIPLFR